MQAFRFLKTHFGALCTMASGLLIGLAAIINLKSMNPSQFAMAITFASAVIFLGFSMMMMESLRAQRSQHTDRIHALSHPGALEHREAHDEDRRKLYKKTLAVGVVMLILSIILIMIKIKYVP